jgi:hypothetical protein
MVDIDSLTRALPVSQLEPNNVAFLRGFVDVPRDQEWKVNVALLEPPAGQHELYLDPVIALEMILRRNGLAPETAISAASALVRLMSSDIPQQRRVTYFNTVDPNPSDCVPVSEFVGWLREPTNAERDAELNRHSRQVALAAYPREVPKGQSAAAITKAN